MSASQDSSSPAENPSPDDLRPEDEPVSGGAPESEEATGSEEAAESITAPAAPWSLGRRVGFRFLFSVFWLDVFPFPLLLPGTHKLVAPLVTVWQEWVVWAGTRLLGFPEFTHVQTGSGDTTYDWIDLLVTITTAVVATGIWSVLDRRRPHYRRLAHWLVVAVRYYLAFVLLGYGFAKLIKTQFPFPGIRRLLTPYGDSSPMGLVWTFMGFSMPYNVFTGLGEVVGSLLLLYRRTTTLGALVVIGVMSNVAMLNYSYDIPVKLFSTQLLILAFALVALDGRRLLALFVQGRAVPAVVLEPHFRQQRWRRLALAVKLLMIGLVLHQNVSSRLEMYGQWGDGRDKPDLYGLWDVERFAVDGEESPPLLTDPVRWQNVIVEWEGYLTVRGMDGSFHSFTVVLDDESETATLARTRDRETTFLWHWERPDDDTLRLCGELDDQEIEVDLKHRPLDDFLLVGRGFHWVSERPFNR